MSSYADVTAKNATQTLEEKAAKPITKVDASESSGFAIDTISKEPEVADSPQENEKLNKKKYRQGKNFHDLQMFYRILKRITKMVLSTNLLCVVGLLIRLLII